MMIYRIYSIRLGIVSYYNFRISKSQAQLDDGKKQRDTVIERLKTATKYNTTQELLQKYGGTPAPRNKSEGASQGKPSAARGNIGAPQVRRTGIIPPPTANIARPAGTTPILNNDDRSPSGSNGSYRQLPPSFSKQSSPNSLRAAPSSPQTETAEFAPNAFSTVPQYAQPTKGSRWFDRLMDVVLGEDESLPSNRIALICKQCRLVNGQAPPGVKRLEEVGKWRCGECGTMNGEDTEVKKILAGLKEEKEEPEKYRQKIGKGGYSASPASKDRNLRSRSVTKKEKADEDEEEEDELAKDQAEVIADSEEAENSDITQYSDASASDPAIETPQTPSKSKNSEATASPATAITAGTAETEAETEQTPLRRRAGRPKGSRNKRSV